MKYFIKTFGCQMNVSDSERIAAFLEQHDFSACGDIFDADLIIFNTCGIKQTAENRAYSMVNNIRKKKLQNIQIVMTGCLANRKDVQTRMKKSVDLFFSISDFESFKNWIIENYLEIGNLPSGRQGWKLEIPVQKNIPINKENIAYLSIRPKHSNHFQAFVPVMTGCNNFCSYCVVPYARGREVSRSANEIISEVKDLVKNGCKNITLLGQNVNSYHSNMQTCKHANKLPKEINFTELLKEINSIPGKFWINFVSSHPKDMNDELIEAVTKLKKVCEWIHLPIQSGDNKILEKMNRRYTKEHYLKLIKKIRSSFKKKQT